MRSLQKDTEKKLSSITRDYKVDFMSDPPLLTVISGKLTTYRCLAKDAVDQFRLIFPNMKFSQTLLTPLPGGDLKNKNFNLFYKQFCNEYSWLPEKIAIRYARNYGSRVSLLLKNMHCIQDLGEDFSHGLYENEVNYLMQYEWAQSSSDILWRRSKLGLYFSKDEIKKLELWISNHSERLVR